MGAVGETRERKRDLISADECCKSALQMVWDHSEGYLVFQEGQGHIYLPRNDSHGSCMLPLTHPPLRLTLHQR